MGPSKELLSREPLQVWYISERRRAAVTTATERAGDKEHGGDHNDRERAAVGS